MAWERSFHLETLILFSWFQLVFILITKCSVTHNKVINIQDSSDYMLKSSKCGPDHASKMKSCIKKLLYRLRSNQTYSHFEDFFIDQRWLKFHIFYHISTPCVILIIWVKSAEGYNLLGTLKSTLCRSNHFVFSKIFKRNLTIIIFIKKKEQWIMVCFSLIGIQRKVPRSMQAGTT